MTLGILLVDPQYDFFPGGALPVATGDTIVAPLNALIARHPGAKVYASRDWHPESTRHFAAGGGPWPPHCVQNSRGAAFHDELRLPEDAGIYSKGNDPADDAGYSAFEGRSDAGHLLAEDLARDGVTSLVIAGLATDYCVKATVLDARKHGFPTFVFAPGIGAVDLKPGDGEQALDAMIASGAMLVTR